jgi:hypothetical protein
MAIIVSSTTQGPQSREHSHADLRDTPRSVPLDKYAATSSHPQPVPADVKPCLKFKQRTKERRGRKKLFLPRLSRFRFDLSHLSDYLLEVGYLASDYVEVGAPEVDALDVDAEAFGEGDGVGEAGGGEEVIVVGAEGVGGFEIAGIQAEAEEEAEGIGIIVERQALVMAFDISR